MSGSAWSGGVVYCGGSQRRMRVGYYPQRFRPQFYSYRSRAKASYCVIAKKRLKRNYIMNGREREGEKRGGGRKIERDRLFYDRAGLCRCCGAYIG